MTAVILADEDTGLARVPLRGERPAAMACVLGGDPGGTAGLFLAGWTLRKPGGTAGLLLAGCTLRKLVLFRSWQVEQDGALELLGWVLGDWGHVIQAAGIEEFRSGPRAVKLHGTTAAATSRLVTAMSGAVSAAGIAVAVRPAATVKKWATDDRLRASGLLAATSGMPDHARDASRQALFTACHDLGLRDPLSRARGEEP